MGKFNTPSIVKEFYLANIDETVRDATSFGGIIVPTIIIALFLGFSRETTLLILGLVLIGFVANTIKYFYPKDRPNPQNYTNKSELINSRSFPSTHVARATFVYISLSYVSQNTRLSPIFILIIIFVTASRIYLRKHYWVDVFGGLVLGYLIYLLCVLCGGL